MRFAAGFVLLLASPVLGFDFQLDPVWIAGGSGSGVGKFGEPESVAFDSLGRVVVTDKGHMRLHVYGRHDGMPLFDVGGLGSGLGALDRPNGIAVDAAGRILVVEQRNERVQVFDRDYRSLGAFGSRGTGPGSFLKPMGIALDPQGRIYVTDEARADVQVFDADGGYLWRFAHDDPRLSKVESIEVHTPSGRILVCDEGRSRVNVYDLDGNFHHAFGTEGSGPGEFGNDPNAVRFDGRGRIYVNDQGNSRINVYDADTSFLASFRSGAGGMESADGVALSERYNLFVVADQGHNRVLAFDLGEMQCRLARVEVQPRAPEPIGLAVYLDAGRTRPATAAWPDATLHLEARGDAGDPAVVERAVVHARSRRDPRGVCLPLVETGPATGLYCATLQLDTAGSGDRLATFAADSVWMHFPGGRDLFVVGWDALDAPRAESLRLDGLDSPAVVVTESPQIEWRFVDPAGLRQQTSFELRLVRTGDGTIVWESGEVTTSDSRARLPAQAPGVLHGLDLRVSSGRSKSAWTRFEWRRNTPPRLAELPQPAPAARIATWPVPLHATVPPDPDGDTVRASMELELPTGSMRRSPGGVAIDGRLTWLPPMAAVGENSRVRWRVRVDDGFETRVGIWWDLHVDALEEPPTPPVPLRGDSILTGATLVWQWHPSLDPDPLDVPRYAVEWSPDANFTEPQRIDAGTQTSVAWRPQLDDTEIFWVVIAEDASAQSSRSDPMGTQLQRRWTARLRLQTDRLESPPLTLGVRGSARDETGVEDQVAPPQSHGPELVAHNAHDTADLSTDLRAPRDDGRWTWHVEARGTPHAGSVLVCESLDLPRGLEARLQDATGRTVGTLRAPRSAHRIELGPHGTARLQILVEPAVGTRETDRRSPRTQDAGTLGEVDMRLAIPNPLGAGARVALPGTAETGMEWRLFDVRGRRLRSWSGVSAWNWDGRDSDGLQLPHGLYVLEVRSGAFATRRKVIWMKP